MRNTSEKTAIKLHIFDMDGTLLDSMRMWDNISSDYLRTKGIEPPENLASILDPMSLQLSGCKLESGQSLNRIP